MSPAGEMYLYVVVVVAVLMWVSLVDNTNWATIANAIATTFEAPVRMLKSVTRKAIAKGFNSDIRELITIAWVATTVTLAWVVMMIVWIVMMTSVMAVIVPSVVVMMSVKLIESMVN